VKRTLKEWIQGIEDERPFVGLKPYSHNIINISLQAIAKEYGGQAANKIIDVCDLESLGWKKEAE
jgi:hypothetical protein